MIRILFVCHGNICRSPMAEFMLKDIINQKQLQHQFIINSAAVSYEEEGNSIYPPAKRTLQKHHIIVGHHQARRMQPSDYDQYDYIIGMDTYNLNNIARIIAEDPMHKVHRLLDFTDQPRDILDPWYTGDFERAYQDIHEGLEALLKHLLSNKNI